MHGYWQCSSQPRVSGPGVLQTSSAMRGSGCKSELKSENFNKPMIPQRVNANARDLSTHYSTDPSAHRSALLSSLAIHWASRSADPSAHPSTYPTTHPSTTPSVHLSTHPSAILSSRAVQ
ncbi:hypothetical protein K435DRAFT_880508 [Dendrothele bispora CBS 962.96]|uniref:Uncharacterized protein n=1 Tax=Dendrothele bispora (strain CBS 962.96) TaxID=1314807 RepID=A0A4S8KJQ2_DENBC|nr:hypothetical protein K435DRAFT_880508 [Dendrothele bispora CBS 962.96]